MRLGNCTAAIVAHVLSVDPNFTAPFPRGILWVLSSYAGLAPSFGDISLLQNFVTSPQVLVLVSGGSDSVALLLTLEQAAKTFQPALRVHAAHFNHALRGKDSDADEEFVVDMARRLGVPLHVRRWKGKCD